MENEKEHPSYYGLPPDASREAMAAAQARIDRANEKARRERAGELGLNPETATWTEIAEAAEVYAPDQRWVTKKPNEGDEQKSA